MARRFGRKPEDNSVPLDMTPMIDCIFLLLIFFILTSKFTPDEKAIASLLPTDKGQARSASTSPIPKEQVNIKIYPAGPAFGKGYQPSEYRNAYKALKEQLGNRPLDRVTFQIGGQEIQEVSGTNLRMAGGDGLNREVEGVHQYIFKCLDNAAGDMPKTGKDSAPVIIHCFSQLSWKFALLAYDAVRDYERVKGGTKLITKNAELADAREVTFAPPRLRNYSSNEDGNELYEIIHLR